MSVESLRTESITLERFLQGGEEAEFCMGLKLSERRKWSECMSSVDLEGNTKLT